MKTLKEQATANTSPVRGAQYRRAKKAVGLEEPSTAGIADYQIAQPFLFRLKKVSRVLTARQYKTLKGQALAGDIEGAERGLWRILERGPEQ